jgi:TonB family protein
MKKNLVVCSFLAVLLALSAPVSAIPQGDILLQLRFYEGVRGPKPAEVKIVTAYTLRPLFIGNFISERGLEEEESELKRVFNLKGLSVLAQTQWGWERDKAEKRFQMVVLNGHEFLLQVVKLAAADSFQVQVLDRAKKDKPALLDNEIVLPAGKVAVFGFEDSLSRPYFLAMQRHADADVIQEQALQIVPAPEARPVPKILKKVDPVYPPKMLAAGLPGSVTIQVEVNEQGKVWSVKAFRSENDEFVKAAVAAVSQWQFEPLVVDGKAQSQVFTCTFNFVGGGVALAFPNHSETKPFRAIWPTSGYIWEQGEKRPDGTIAALVKKTGKMYYMSSGFGKRLNPYTKKEEFHPGVDILAKIGAPVNSTTAGTVTVSEFNDQDGNRVVIDHGNGYTSAYHHLHAREVKAGDRVEQGQRIGTVGSTGVSTGPHLHFEIRVNGEPRNPFDFIGR